MKKLLLLAVAGTALAGSVQAQTVINITGATAFRTAAVTAINAAFNSGGSFSYGFANTDVAAATTSLTNGTNQIWRGTFGTISGTTIIRTSWNGSIEGVRALVAPGGLNNADYLLTSVASVALTAGGGTPATRNFGVDRETAVADLAFSDATINSSPLTGTVFGGPVGTVVFSMIANRTWKNDDATATAGLNSISAQQFKTLAAAGSLPLGFFKGNSTETTRVYLTGRNDGSGTRTIYLAETGYGIARAVQQYVVHDRSSPTNAPIILKTAKGGGFNFQGVATPDYKSTVWSNDTDGNGGYVSGGDLRTDLTKTTTSTAVWEFADQDFSDDFDASEDAQVTAAAKLYLLTWITASDARSARGTGLASAATAKVLGYNGVILDGLAGDNPPSQISVADRAKVANGAYTAWSYQQLYHLNSANQVIVFNSLKASLNTVAAVGTAGVPLGEMNVNRSSDGGNILTGPLP